MMCTTWGGGGVCSRTPTAGAHWRTAPCIRDRQKCPARPPGLCQVGHANRQCRVSHCGRHSCSRCRLTCWRSARDTSNTRPFSPSDAICRWGEVGSRPVLMSANVDRQQRASAGTAGHATSPHLKAPDVAAASVSTCWGISRHLQAWHHRGTAAASQQHDKGGPALSSLGACMHAHQSCRQLQALHHEQSATTSAVHKPASTDSTAQRQSSSQPQHDRGRPAQEPCLAPSTGLPTACP